MSRIDDILDSLREPTWKTGCENCKQLQAELDKHRWIPVSEGLPKLKTKVWIASETGFTVGSYSVFAHDNKTKGWFSNGGEEIFPPTYWMPIIPPEQEKGGE